MASRPLNTATSGSQIDFEPAFRNPNPQPVSGHYLMLPIALVNEIDSLLHDGTLSQRKIAARLGVSRGVVSAIANGRRGLHGHDPFETHSPPVPTSPPTRCPQCGYRVYLPCLVCRTRVHRQQQIMLGLLARTHKSDNRGRRRSAG